MIGIAVEPIADISRTKSTSSEDQEEDRKPEKQRGG